MECTYNWERRCDCCRNYKNEIIKKSCISRRLFYYFWDDKLTDDEWLQRDILICENCENGNKIKNSSIRLENKQYYEKAIKLRCNTTDGLWPAYSVKFLEFLIEKGAKDFQFLKNSENFGLYKFFYRYVIEHKKNNNLEGVKYKGTFWSYDYKYRMIVEDKSPIYIMLVNSENSKVLKNIPDVIFRLLNNYL